MEPRTHTFEKRLLLEHYTKFLIGLIEYGNMPLASWEEEPHHLRLITGCEDEEFNSIFSLEEPMEDVAKIKKNIQRMRSKKLPFTWVIPEEKSFGSMESLLIQQGLHKQAPSQGMIGVPLRCDTSFKNVRIKEVRSENSLNLWLDLYEKSFFIESAPLLRELFKRAFLEAGIGGGSPFQADIALLDNHPVGVNLLFYSHERQVGGFWCTGVIPPARGKGVAKALIHHRMNEMYHNHCPHAATWLDQNATLFPLFSRLHLETKLKLFIFSCAVFR